MPRMNRADSQAHTRALLLASARKLFLRDGYNATGITAVTEHAGFSSGAFYSNFPNKAALALEVLQAIQTERTKELEAILGARSPDIGKRVDSWSEEVLRSGWPVLELEFALAVRGDLEFVKEEGGRHFQSVSFIAQSIEEFLPSELVEILPINQLAEAMMNLVVGVAVRRIIDPKVSFAPLSELGRLAGSFLRSGQTDAAPAQNAPIVGEKRPTRSLMSDPTYPATAYATVQTDRPERYGKQLVSHLGRRYGGEWDSEKRDGWIDLASGRATVTAGDGALQLHVAAAGSDELSRLEDVVGRHLIRFCEQDGLTVTWEHDSAPQ